jgi:hypothetical protein
MSLSLRWGWGDGDSPGALPESPAATASLTLQGNASSSPTSLRLTWLGHKVFTPWRAIAEFANYEVENFDDYRVISGDSTQTDPFSAIGGRLQIFCASGLSDVELAGFLSIDLYHYPDKRFVKTAVDDTWTDDGVDNAGPTKNFFSVKVGKGMYCLYVSSSAHVTWAVTVSECV